MRAPEHLERAVAGNVVASEPYGPQAGLLAARESVQHDERIAVIFSGARR